ncbi:Tat (twin-arginine translocation) pathway signal sequence [Mesobacillus subterraneus]|uniref:M14 family zinc carboxypeptidase n=1 Tax=Mesobacillus subterraneus TaxID=285983 RepID=UPI00203FB3CC|nr:M14 family zinc carboxypeptidase [Mesobacillus subterraneus]MCM3665821.1 Tat (twin-arginine translocation) pathway signal sequence [Mesobacillus subterraneus]MCM3684788.1 Tat (twin-arginine translocation) pathway signal sequence [Mesobacillus subterraneus]
MIKRIINFATAALIFMLAFSSTSLAALQPGGPSTNGNTNINSTLSYTDVVKILEDIERTSKGKVEVSTLDQYGKSEQGRSIYVAKLGTGPQKIWIQAQIHGNEKLVTEAALQLLKTYANSGEKDVERVLEEATLYFIPMYNPDGAEMNIRHTKLAESGKLIDLNRDWTLTGFEAVESKVVYAYWADVKPDFAIDLHHQGLKQVYGTNESTSFSLGISLAPDGPTLPGTGYNKITKQMMAYVYDELKDYGYTHIDRYQVGVNREKGIGYDIDIRGGVVSAMMMGLNYNNLNPEGHSHPAVFFETKGNTSDGSLGQKSNGYLTKQNYLALKSLVYGYVTGEVENVNENEWYKIPYYPLAGYLTDYAGTIPVNTDLGY